MKKISVLLLLITNAVISQTWQPLNSTVTNTLNQRFDDVFFLTKDIGWAANGYFATVYKTTDGGINWIAQLSESNLGSDHYFRNIEFLDENIGFLGTLNNKFYKTTDGGSTWTLINNISPNPPAICGLDCVGTSTIYGCGAYFSPAYIIKSSDSGNTWQHIDMSAYADALVEVLFLDENTGFAAGKNPTGGVILKTTDGGATWTQLYNSNITGDYVWKLQVLNTNQNIIFGAVEGTTPNPGKLTKSSNGGLNWTETNTPETFIQAVGFLDENHGWMGGHTTGFYETTDGGTTWTNTGIGSNLNRIFFIENTAYAAGTTIYKMSDVLSSNNFAEQNRTLLKINISPNPITEKLNIGINFLAEDHVLIELYNSNGKFIKHLTKDDINCVGTKKYTFDFPYPTGVYYLDFHTNTGRQTSKIIKN